GVMEAEAAVPCTSATLHSRMAKAIVGRTLVRILEYLVRLRQLLELLFRLCGAVVPVRVVLQRQLAIRSLDRVRIRTALHTQYLVIITHSLHRWPVRPVQS